MKNQAGRAIRIVALALAAVVGLGGCQTTPSRGAQRGDDSLRAGATTAAEPQEEVGASEYVSRAIERLQVGDAESARHDLERALALQPRSRTARSLLAQLDADPEAELGSEYFEYRAQSGDSLSIIAKKFLGDSLKFYILARYNDLDDPSKLDVGDVVKVPVAPRSETAMSRPTTPADAAAATQTPAVEPEAQRKLDVEDYELAKVLCSSGEYESAIEILESDQEDEASRELLAMCYGAYAEHKASVNQLSEARSMLVSAVALDPGNKEYSTKLAAINDKFEAQLLYERGMRQLRSGDPESALASFNQALVLRPGYAQALEQRDLVRKRLIDGYLKRAEEAFTQQRLDDAITAWDEVLALDPRNVTARSRKDTALKVKARLQTQ